MEFNGKLSTQTAHASIANNNSQTENPPMILCLGTTPVYQRTMIFDRLTPDAVNRAKEVSDYASGKSVNAARVIHTLGGPVLATGFTGGRRGQALLADLDSAAIPHDFVTTPAETRQCITLIDRSTHTATELVEESSPVGPESWRELESKLNQLLPRAKVWIFSGTLAPDANPDFYARRLPLATQCGAKCIIDVVGQPLRLAMRHPNAILKMNRDELARTLNQDLYTDTALITAMRQNVPQEGALIVTLGADGAVACDPHSCWRCPSPTIQPVSAVGSGDSFAAGLALALHNNQPLPEALKLAVACGAANAMMPKAGFLEKPQVDHLVRSIRPERMV
jgi:tagatose 6-phosphate kinase